MISVGGGVFGAAGIIENNTSGGLAKVIADIQAAFNTAETTVSPLVLDLDNNGVDTLNKTAGIHFDHDGNRFAETTGWVGKNDGLLVWDRNNNGKIDNGSELFGSQTRLADGKLADNGFAALAELDTNHDGKVDASDADFGQLRVWKDGDSDAVVSDGELLTLDAAGVQSLSTSFTSQTVLDAQNNKHLQAGQYTRTDGSTQAMDDVWFAMDTTKTIDQDLVAVSDEIAALPDLQAFGNVHSLHQAMARDTSGRLQSLLTSFIAASDSDTRHSIMTTLLYAWAGVENIDPDSRAATLYYGNVIGDARKLATLECFLGESYLGTWCWGERDPNPHGKAAPILIAAFDQMVTQYSAQLLAQVQYKSLYDSVGLVWNDATSSFDLDVSAVVTSLQTKYTEDAVAGAAWMHEFGQNLKTNGDFGVQVLNTLTQQGDAHGQGFAFELSQLGYVLALGNDNDNTLYGNNDRDNSLFGLGGDDHLYGKNMDDILDGGAGNDWLFGIRNSGHPQGMPLRATFGRGAPRGRPVRFNHQPLRSIHLH